MVFVTLAETYDLSTKTGKISMIGIHTPNREIIEKTYPGLLMQCKFMRVVKQDVAIACASMLPSDPLQVGFEDGQIAPQDMFNPILYKACSNDSFSTIEARLLGLQNEYGTRPVDVSGNQAVIEQDNAVGNADDFKVYYSLLADHDGWKKAHPQQGLNMKGLIPLVFDKYYNVGENKEVGQTTGMDEYYPVLSDAIGSDEIRVSNYAVRGFRGRAHPMPKINTTYVTNATLNTGNQTNNGINDGLPANSQTRAVSLPPIYTACILLPPCTMSRFFYRMTVRTTLEFTEVRPIQDIINFGAMARDLFPIVYHSDYNEQSKSMKTTLGMVDTDNADLTKIMDGA